VLIIRGLKKFGISKIDDSFLVILILKLCLGALWQDSNKTHIAKPKYSRRINLIMEEFRTLRESKRSHEPRTSEKF
jgi:hypothetical protein